MAKFRIMCLSASKGEWFEGLYVSNDSVEVSLADEIRILERNPHILDWKIVSRNIETEGEILARKGE